MIEIIRSQDKERLAARLQAIHDRNVAFDDALVSEVAAIIRDVRTRGDAALIDYTARFDKVQLQTSDLRVAEDTLHWSAEKVDHFVLESLREAIHNVRREDAGAGQARNGKVPLSAPDPCHGCRQSGSVRRRCVALHQQ